ncbi:MAG: alpha-E domain-containing protein, partial [Alphaproteobacteria bacterium]|nr:alpha-E domain-containing protein [Alphaproteobacteria bacterium]
MLSRVADSLYWMARYLERGEHTARLIAVKLESMVEQSQEDSEAAWHRVVEALSGEEFAPKAHDAYAITQAI